MKSINLTLAWWYELIVSPTNRSKPFLSQPDKFEHLHVCVHRRISVGGRQDFGQKTFWFKSQIIVTSFKNEFILVQDCNKTIFFFQNQDFSTWGARSHYNSQHPNYLVGDNLKKKSLLHNIKPYIHKGYAGVAVRANYF